MRFSFILIAAVVCMLIASCGEATPVCPTSTETPVYLSGAPAELATPTPGMGSYQVVMGGGNIQVDKLVEGPLCNDTWNGTVYVKCNVQVYPWTEEPTFLEDCQLNIEPQTIVYVAYHNNTAYYNGCSCHTGITPEP